MLALSIEGCQVSNPLRLQNTEVASPVAATVETLTPPTVSVPTETHTPIPTSSPTNTLYPSPSLVLSPENAAQIQQLARLGKGKVNALAYSSDGLYLAVGTSIGVVIYDTHTWSETLFELENSVVVLEFSPKGDFLSVGLKNGVIQLWHVPDWSIARTLVYNTVEPFVAEKEYWKGFYLGLRFQQNVGDIEHVIAFSPDGHLFVAGGWDGIVKVWNVSDGTLLKTIAADGLVNDIVFNSDGSLMAILAWHATLWKIPTLEETYQFSDSLSEYFERVTFSADDKYLIGYSGEKVVFWQISDGQLARGYQVPGWYHTTVDWSRDGKTLVRAGDDFDRGALEVWDIDSARMRSLDVAHPDLINRVVLNPDGATLAVSFADGMIQILDISNNTVLQQLDGFPAGIDDIKLLSNGSELAAFIMLFQHPFLQVRSLSDGAVQNTVDLTKYKAEYDSKIAFSPDASVIAVANKHLQLWNFAKGTLLKTFRGDEENPYSNIRDVVFSSDGDAIAYAFDFGKVMLATTSGEIIQTLEEAYTPDALCMFDDSQTLTTGTQFWDLADGELIKTISNYYGIWYFFTSGCDTFASMTWDGHFKVLQNTSEQLGERVGDFDLRVEGVYFMNPVAFSPDRNLVAVQEAIGKIRIFNLQTNETVAILSGHKATITSLNFSLDGKLLISSSEDGTIRLWGIYP